ncbi:MAG TPA: alginate lyase family protein [Nitrososphaeraceae archaeon]|nr:alginate lyase family protein [Nitrososphaeraceae archaeon]
MKKLISDERYENFNLEPITLRSVVLISIILWSSVIVGFTLSYFYPTNPINAEKVHSIYVDFKFQTTPQLMVFDLPSKLTINENKNPVVKDLISQLIVEADSYLSKKVPSVMDKVRTPPSGDKHDFLSLAPFHWPDDTKPKGIPYVYRDGEFNPEVYTAHDGIFMHRMIERVKILSVAYYFTGNDVYSNKTSELLRVWFLNNDTYMNPNLEHAEVITGKNNGTRSGIIAANNFPIVLDAVKLIEDSPSWTNADQKGIESWFEEYLNWLLNSKFGKKESQAMNNHGTWYDAQASSIALFLNKTEITRNILENNKNNLISEKIQPGGQQSFELDRQNSLDYHIFNLLAFFNLAKIGENIGIDLWYYKTSSGSGLQEAVNYILPFAVGNDTWPHKQTKPIDKDDLHDLICQATVQYENNSRYIESYNSLDANVTNQVDGLIYGCAGLPFKDMGKAEIRPL